MEVSVPVAACSSMSPQQARVWLSRLQRRGWGQDLMLARHEVYDRAWAVFCASGSVAAKAYWIALVAAHLHPSSLIWLRYASAQSEGALKALAEEAFRDCGAKWSLGRLLIA